MSDTTLAIISTLAWVALVGVIIGLFGREDGGAWSIASGVARGVRDWSGGRRRDRHASSTSSPASPASLASWAPDPAAPGTSPPNAELDDYGETPITR